MKLKFKSWLAEALILLALDLVALIFIWPFREFPLSDDWSFALSILHWMERGHLHMVDWSPSIALAHLAWGRLFCQVFGFSFGILRVSNWVMGGVAGLALLGIGHLQAWPRKMRLLIVLCFLYNPLFLDFRFTFMGEISFVAFLTLATLFWLAYLKDDRRILWPLLAGLFSAASVAVRQPGVFLPLAFLLAVLITRRDLLRRPQTWVGLALFGILSGGVLAWYYGIHGPSPVNQNSTRLMIQTVTHPGLLLKTAGSRSIEFSLVAFLVMSPIIVYPLSPLRERVRERGLGILIFLLTLGYVLLTHSTLPFQMGILNNWGVGPTASIPGDMGPLLGSMAGPFWMGLTVLLSIAASLYAPRLIGILISLKEERSSLCFLCLATLFQLPFILIYPWVYDRNLLPLFPFLFPLLGVSLSKERSPSLWSPPRRGETVVGEERLPRLSIFLLALMSAFSVLGVRDHLSWNQARWTLAREAVRKGISPLFIQGGMEFDLWNLYEYCQAYPQQQVRIDPRQQFWVHPYVPAQNPVYRVSFSASPGDPLADQGSWYSCLRQRALPMLLLGPPRPDPGQPMQVVTLHVSGLLPRDLFAFGNAHPQSPGLDALALGARRYGPSGSEEPIDLTSHLSGMGWPVTEWTDRDSASPPVSDWADALADRVDSRCQCFSLRLTQSSDRIQLNRLCEQLFKVFQSKPGRFLFLLAGDQDAPILLFPSPDLDLRLRPPSQLRGDVRAFLVD